MTSFEGTDDDTLQWYYSILIFLHHLIFWKEHNASVIRWKCGDVTESTEVSYCKVPTWTGAFYLSTRWKYIQLSKRSVRNISSGVSKTSITAEVVAIHIFVREKKVADIQRNCISFTYKSTDCVYMKMGNGCVLHAAELIISQQVFIY
jgi:hypothetical protein